MNALLIESFIYIRFANGIEPVEVEISNEFPFCNVVCKSSSPMSLLKISNNNNNAINLAITSQHVGLVYTTKTIDSKSNADISRRVHALRIDCKRRFRKGSSNIMR